jgi:hypothetical protein
MPAKRIYDGQIPEGWIRDKSCRAKVDIVASETMARPDVAAGQTEREADQP